MIRFGIAYRLRLTRLPTHRQHLPGPRRTLSRGHLLDSLADPVCTLARQVSHLAQLPHHGAESNPDAVEFAWHLRPPPTASSAPKHPHDPPEAVRSPRFACRDTRHAPARQVATRASEARLRATQTPARSHPG